MSSTRQLAAIMFTDIVGYTALMGRDEQKAFELLKENRDIHKPLIKHFHGTWIKEMGDGVLASFHTVTDAVLCASAIHESCNTVEGLRLRIGIHLGEVVFEDHDVFGDGVNIASRLQALAPIGETWISEAVYKNIANKKEFNAEFVMEENLKNVSEPIKIYVIKAKDQLFSEQGLKAKSYTSETRHKLKHKRIVWISGILLLLISSLFYFQFFSSKNKLRKATLEQPDKSIAVLPFLDMSSTHDQEYFSDGMTDEILNHLSKIGGLKVVSRTSSMTYKGSKKTLKDIASELGVTNLVEGSVQKEGSRIRIRAQLIDGNSDRHLWSDSYDEEFKDVFTIQSDIAQQIAAALKVKIDHETKRRIEYIPTENTSAYTSYLLSKAKAFNDNRSWKELLEKVIRLDSSFAPAYADLAVYWLNRGHFRGDLNAKQVLDSALPLLKRSVQLDSNLSSAHEYLALISLWFEWDFKAAEKEWRKFFQLNPSGFLWVENYADFLSASGRSSEALDFALKNRDRDKRDVTNWTSLAMSYYYMNQPDNALMILDSAWSLLKDPRLFGAKAWVLNYLHRYEEANANLTKDFEIFPENRKIPRSQALLAISYFQTNQVKEAEIIVDNLKSLEKQSPVGSPAFHVAMIYAATDRVELAFQWLEKAYAEREVEMFWLKTEPLFYSLHNDSRFKKLLKKVGFT